MFRLALRRVTEESRTCNAVRQRVPSLCSKFQRRSLADKYPQDARVRRLMSSTASSVAVGSLIAGCCGVFYWQQYTPTKLIWTRDNYGIPRRRVENDFADNFICSRENVSAGRWWVLLTHSFAHGSLPHLAMNMFGLWQLGRPAVAFCGLPVFATIWIATSVGSTALQVYWPTISTKLPRKVVIAVEGSLGLQEDKRSVGASGALCGVWAFMAVNFPRIFSRSLMLTAAFDIICLATGTLPWMGHLAHLNGMASGVIMAALLRGRRIV